MMTLMVKEADLNRIDMPEKYEVLDATALSKRLKLKRDTAVAYLSQLRQMNSSAAKKTAAAAGGDFLGAAALFALGRR